MIIERIRQIIDFKGVAVSRFEKEIGASDGTIRNAIKKNTEINSKWLVKISELYPEINLNWLLTGNPSMLEKADLDKNSKKNLIPLYEDVSTIGGRDLVADMSSVYNTSIQVDAGDWFKGATAAIRHYGDSMVEYPSGCILAIRELKDKTEIVWGRNYVVETNERRITKQVAELDRNNIICYSTNTDKHPDERLKHQPITILKEDIRYISRVLGSVNKEESTGKVQLL